MTQQDLFRDAERRRDVGMANIAAGADNAVPGWNEDAYRLLTEFIVLARGKTFLAEDFVRYAKDRIVAPHDARAWGGPIQKAAKRRLIMNVGFGRAATSNMSPKTKWQERV
jgi:hypothetical protein